MSLSWHRRKSRLAYLLNSQGDEDTDGVALDRLLHGQRIIGKTSKTTEIDGLRFQDRDLVTIGTLEYGQFGVIYVVSCRLDGRVYVQKSIEKRFALRNRDQCFPQSERDILLQAAKTNSLWAPHLLCAFQTPTHLNLIMDYAEGGNLWDVLESSPHNGKIVESNLRWWTPQIVSAIHWCHSQGFVHRDIKPHNFVLTPTAHVLLIDFGSVAPLLPPTPDGVQYLPKRFCLVPCGTCDYISPEILHAHEEALVALEMEDEEDFQLTQTKANEHGYARETDWWSLGAMLYEMAYGFAPFFAKDIRKTYLRIMDHEKSLHYDETVAISAEYKDLISLLLTRAERRLGRHHIQEITSHAAFENVNWDTLSINPAPPDLHLPQFIFAEPANLCPEPPTELSAHSPFEESYSRGFNFSALFQSTIASSSPALSTLLSKSSQRFQREDTVAAFIGFSWGPTPHAFPFQDTHTLSAHENGLDVTKTPQSVRLPSTYLTPNPNFITPRWSSSLSRPLPSYTHSKPDTLLSSNRYTTPMRPTSLTTPFQTLQRPSTVQRPALRRNVSDREAMKQLVDCIGMSARKKVLESGRKPRILTNLSCSAGSLNKVTRKDLGFAIPAPNYAVSYSDSTATMTSSSFSVVNVGGHGGSVAEVANAHQLQASGSTTGVGALSGSEDTTDSECPPSPSPTPRPGSSMSILSVRRVSTPTVSSMRMSMNTMTTNTTTMLLGVPRGRSSSLSFSRSLSNDATCPGPALVNGDGDDAKHDDGQGARRELGIVGMERRLGKLVSDIASLESKLATAKRRMN